MAAPQDVYKDLNAAGSAAPGRVVGVVVGAVLQQHSRAVDLGAPQDLHKDLDAAGSAAPGLVVGVVAGAVPERPHVCT